MKGGRLTHINLVPIIKWKRLRVSQKTMGSLDTSSWEESGAGYSLSSTTLRPLVLAAEDCDIVFPATFGSRWKIKKAENNCEGR